MPVTQRDIKLLWGRAASRCAICKTELSYENSVNSENIILGEQAHIVSEQVNGPRGESILTLEERNCYDNLILLCPTHHTQIDSDVHSYPVEKLHNIKSKHEFWVNSQLSSSGIEEVVDPNEIIYATLIDYITTACALEDFCYWSNSMSSYNIRLKSSFIHGAYDLRKRIACAILPGTKPELEVAIDLVSKVFLSIMNLFSLHCDLDSRDYDYYVEDRFYKIKYWSTEDYDRLLKQYHAWKDTINELLRDFCRIINWYSSIVRKEFNPLYFSLEGKFSIETSDIYNRSFSVFEFSSEDIKQLPELMNEKIHHLTQPFDTSTDE